MQCLIVFCFLCSMQYKLSVLFLQELSSYLKVSTGASVIVDKSSDGEFLRIDFNIRYGVMTIILFLTKNHPFCVLFVINFLNTVRSTVKNAYQSYLCKTIGHKFNAFTRMEVLICVYGEPLSHISVVIWYVDSYFS